MVPSPVVSLYHCIGFQSCMEYKQAIFKECGMRLNAESRMHKCCIYRRHIKASMPLSDGPCIFVDIFSPVHLPPKWIVTSFRSKNNNKQQTNITPSNITKHWVSQRPPKKSQCFWPASTTIKPNQPMRTARKVNA